MITLDFSSALAAYIFLLLSAISAAWLFSKNERVISRSLNPKFIWFCAICSYTYINTKDEVISRCPRCASYNKK